MPRKINYSGYQTGGSTSNFDANEDRVRYYEELMSQESGPEDKESILQRLLGGWDNRLGGEGEAQRLHERRQEMEESRAAKREYERQEREPELWRLMHEERERRRTPDFLRSPEKIEYMMRQYSPRGGGMEVPRRASGGIIGLQTGGPAPTASRVTSYGVPQQTAQQWANLTDRIVTEGQRPYQQYGGQRIAGFTQPEAAAMAGRVAYGQGMGPMGTRQAAQTLGQAGQMIGGAQQGLMGLQPQYAQMAGQFGAAAPLAQQQAQQAAQGMGQLSARSILQGQLAGAGMRTTGREALTAQEKFATGLPSEGGVGGIVGMGAAAQEKATTGAGTVREIGELTAAPEMQRGANLQDYMSQYTAGVTDPQLQQLLEFQKMQGQELGSEAAAAGAFGGLRQGVQAATQARDVSQQAGEIIGKGQQEAFESAQQAFQAAQAGTQLGLGALQAAQGARQQGWGTYGQMLGQQQGAIGAQGQLYGQMGGMGGQLAGVGGQQMQLGGQQQQQQFERLRGMEAAGEKQRQMQQQSLGMGYQDWQNELNQERANIGWQQSAMGGLPYQGTVTQSAYQPQTGPGASAMSAGIGGLGAWNEYQQTQQGATPASASESWEGGRPESFTSGPLFGNQSGGGANPLWNQ
jgi:hypothetical protein